MIVALIKRRNPNYAENMAVYLAQSAPIRVFESLQIYLGAIVKYPVI
jgi:hypothetical protein